jgi:hypothetical protein
MAESWRRGICGRLAGLKVFLAALWSLILLAPRYEVSKEERIWEKNVRIRKDYSRSRSSDEYTVDICYDCWDFCGKVSCGLDVHF